MWYEFGASAKWSTVTRGGFVEIRLKLDLMPGIWKQRRKNGGHSRLGNHMKKDTEVGMRRL